MPEKYVPPRLRGNKNNNKNDDIDKKKERELRFSKGASTHYGFVSRGEDRLRSDGKARTELLKETLARLKLLELAGFDLVVKGLQLPDHDTGAPKGNADTVLQNLRKLREALLQMPHDRSTKVVFLLSVRLGCLTRHFQAMVPAAAYILEHPKMVNNDELQEVASLHALYLLHHVGDTSSSMRILHQHLRDNGHVNDILFAWTREEFVTWFQLYLQEKNTFFKKVMQSGATEMSRCLVKCFTSSFFVYPVASLEHILGGNYDTLKAEYSIPWQEKNGVLTIRERK